ncbi:hypothetical protein FRC10_007514 [Ceratobasidium sp. 414]|nr:hypothetical protein FRC10_007514 [Ceratobasidium sp. 414]
MNAGGLNWYDISNIQAYSVPQQISTSCGSVTCTSATCPCNQVNIRPIYAHLSSSNYDRIRHTALVTLPELAEAPVPSTKPSVHVPTPTLPLPTARNFFKAKVPFTMMRL